MCNSMAGTAPLNQQYYRVRLKNAAAGSADAPDTVRQHAAAFRKNQV